MAKKGVQANQAPSMRANDSAVPNGDLGIAFWRKTWATLAGLIYNGKRDMYAVFGYRERPVYRDYYAKYTRQDIARRVVDAPATATWRNPPELRSSNTKLVESWNALVDQFQLWSHVSRADRLSGIGNYAVMLLGFDDVYAPEIMMQPAKNNCKLLYMQIYSQLNAYVIGLDRNPSSPRFGLPEYYAVSIQSPMLDVGMMTMDAASVIPGMMPGSMGMIGIQRLVVHHSRIVHIAEDTLESEIIGTPRLEPVINLLDDLMKVTGGTAETYWLNANRGMQIDVDKDAQMTPADEAALNDELDDYNHKQRRFLRTRGVKITPLHSDVPNPEPSFRVLMALLSGATGIPQRILMGSEAGQLASDQDRANWADKIKERRVTFAVPRLLLPLMVKLMNAGVLPKTNLSDIAFWWPLSFQLTPLEEAQMMAQKARAAINLSKHLATNPLMSKSEARQLMGMSAQMPPDMPDAPIGVQNPKADPTSQGGPPAKPDASSGTSDQPPGQDTSSGTKGTTTDDGDD